MKFSVEVKTSDDTFLTLSISAENEGQIEGIVRSQYRTVREVVSVKKKEEVMKERKEKSQKEKEELERQRLFIQGKTKNKWSSKRLG